MPVRPNLGWGKSLVTWVIYQNFCGGDGNGPRLWRTKGWGPLRQLELSELPDGRKRGRNAGFPWGQGILLAAWCVLGKRMWQLLGEDQGGVARAQNQR